MRKPYNHSQVAYPMKQITIVLVLLVTVLGCSHATAPSPATSYRLTVNGKSYYIQPKKTLTVPTEDGQRITLLLEAPKAALYQDDTISFEYPIGCVLKKDHTDAHTTIKLESPENATMVISVVYNAPKGKDYKAVFLSSLRKKFLNRGFAVIGSTERSISKAIAGANRAGTYLEVRLDKIEMAVEVYMLRKGNSLVIVSMEYAKDAHGRAEPFFNMVASSLK